MIVANSMLLSARLWTRPPLIWGCLRVRYYHRYINPDVTTPDILSLYHKHRTRHLLSMASVSIADLSFPFESRTEPTTPKGATNHYTQSNRWDN